MPDLAGNLTTISVVDDDLVARFPVLNRYLADGQADWSAQRGQGRFDALEAFRVIRGENPARAKAESDDDWKRILTFFSLSVAFAGMGSSPEMIEEASRWREMGMEAIGRFVYRYDLDLSGDLSQIDAEEDATSGREIILRR